jgi:hypothetical protein
MPRTRSGRKVTRSGANPSTQTAVQPEPAEPQSVAASQPTAGKRIRLITNGPWNPEANYPQTMMGRAIRPFAKPAQSGTFAPFAVAQARRGR